MLSAAVQSIAKESQAGPSQVAVQEGEMLKRQIVVSIPDMKLALVEEGRVLKIYPVAVGTPATPTPTGAFRIINRITSPTYHHQGKVVAPGGSNPLGSRWLGLSRKSYGIHGTNVPSSIGHAASHGCIRMHRYDVEELFTLVRVGDLVEIHGERNMQLARIFGDPKPALRRTSGPAIERAPQLSPVAVAVMAGAL